MLDTALGAVVEYLRRNTAFPGWAVEFILWFVACVVARFVSAVWDSTAVSDETLWAGFWSAYDNLGAFADDSAIAALIFTIIVEVFVMVLARKLLRINREEGLEEGREEGRQRGREEGREEGRQEVRAELEPIIEQLQERIHQLENGEAPAEPPPPPTT